MSWLSIENTLCDMMEDRLDLAWASEIIPGASEDGSPEQNVANIGWAAQNIIIKLTPKRVVSSFLANIGRKSTSCNAALRSGTSDSS